MEMAVVVEMQIHCIRVKNDAGVLFHMVLTGTLCLQSGKTLRSNNLNFWNSDTISHISA